ncbi:chaplin [Streptomyces sp. NPDC002779]|uniref:chaplin n=1 Tax=Streptomyces sp. NPDC002779 TaxID=3364664 RepID=UPI0036CD5532
MVAAAAATSILSLCGAPALADTSADGGAKDSPGVASGNDVSAPVELPVNACGNTVDVVAALNPSFGNDCATADDATKRGAYGEPYDDSGYGHGDDDRDHDDRDHGDGDHGDGDGGYGDTPSPKPPTTPPGGGHTPPGGEHTPPDGGHTPPPPGGEQTPPPPGGDHTPPPPPGGGHTPPPPVGEHTPPPPPGGGHDGPVPMLPETGSGEGMLAASGASAALIAGGAVLYRRGRAASHR